MREGISLCMIVKDEEMRLADCLESARGLADEVIIVVDEDSSDATERIARRYTDKVYAMKWTGSFSDVRNFSISRAGREWILFMDADETISRDDATKLKSLAGKSPEADAFLFQWRNYVNESGISGWKSTRGDPYEEAGAAPGYVLSRILRMFRNRPAYRFEGTIHETPHRSISESRGRIIETDIVLHHFGTLDKDSIPAKKERYISMLKQRLDAGDFPEKPEDYVCFELSRELIISGRPDEAITYLERALGIERRTRYLSGLAGLYITRDRLDEAEKLLKEAVARDPGNPSVHNNLGIIYSRKKLFSKAIRKFERALKLDPRFADAYFNIGLAYVEMGKKDDAEYYLSRAAGINPGFRERAAALTGRP